jgi:hypothetical protein
VSYLRKMIAQPSPPGGVLIDDPARFDGVKVVGVDEHVWRYTRRGDTYVTVIIDLTPIRDKTGPARLLDMVGGRSKQAFTTWLAARPETWREAIEVVAMDGFTGFKNATTEELPDAVAVMDPFHVVRLAGDALDRCRRRIQQIIWECQLDSGPLRRLDSGPFGVVRGRDGPRSGRSSVSRLAVGCGRGGRARSRFR